MRLVFKKQAGSQVKPKVTIGICVRNCEATLTGTLNSVSNQDFPHELMEIIIADDGSEDKTLHVAFDLASKMDMQVKVFSGEWRGIGPARNVIVDNAEGDYIIWVDGDMVLPKNHVKKQVEFMEKNPNVGIAKAKHQVLPEENLVAFLEHVPYLLYDVTPGVLSSKMPGTGGAIYRVLAIRQVKGFDNNLRYAGEDQDAAFRIKKAGWIITHSPAVFYEVRVQTWIKLFKKYIWYGYGNHDLYNKNREIFSTTRMNPLAGFVAGVLYAFTAYRLTKRKSLVLLPLHFVLKMTAWCIGFTWARINYITGNQTQRPLHVPS